MGSTTQEWPLGWRTWEAPELTSLGRLPMRAPLVPFPDVRAARRGEADRERSPWLASLDGEWEFRLAPCPEAVDPAWLAPGSGEGWSAIAVPGNWTVQGWDRPHYTNVQMPFEARPPLVPADNPTGVYRTTVVVPPDWAGRRIVLHVGGAESVLHVWVDGRFVGMGKDSRLPSEFDITEHVRPGTAAVIACVVVRWSDASYVEDQDHWWMAGLHRSVFLYSTGRTHVADVAITAGLADDRRTGTLSVRTEVGFADEPEPGWRVDAWVEDLRGRRRAVTGELGGDVPWQVGPYVFTGHVVRRSVTVPDVEPWSAEAPHLSRLVVALRDPAGAVREVVTQRIGFRSVEVRDRQLLLNGRATYVRGVNRHDHDPRTGKAVTVEGMRADLVTMKRFGFNAVRCSHYPNDHRFLDLCDELGMWVVDEANLESHALNLSLCHDPRYLATWVERVARMVRRDRNHPSVILWSLGNESGYGAGHDAAAAWVRRVDPSRPLHYEGPLMGRLHAAAPVTDVVCPMYASIDEIVEWSERAADSRRPLILCEYSHAMGGSNGSLADYWDAIEGHDGLQGGFIWEWKDHGLLATTDDGREFFAYGGQFGDTPHDANFVADGLVSPDGVPHPAMWEHLWLARPVRVTARPSKLGSKGRITVTSHLTEVDTSWLAAEWEVTVDGEVVERGPLDVPVLAPGARAKVVVPFDRRRVVPAGAEAHLCVRWRTAARTPWAPKGHVVGWDQLPLPLTSALPAPAVSAGPGAGEPVDPVAWVLTAGDRVLRLDPPVVDLWRAAVDNDGIKLWAGQDDKPLGRWLGWGLHHLRWEVTEADGASGVAVGHGADPDVVVRHRRTVTPVPGGVVVAEHVEVPAAWDDLPRVGVRIELPRTFTEVRWWGLGPHENVPDRLAGATVGRWARSVDEPLPYLMPQDFGLRCGLRWMAIEESGRGRGRLGVVVGGLTPHERDLMGSATRYRPDDLFAARDHTELRPRDATIVALDVAHRGVGTGSCGPDTLARYRVGPGTYEWRWFAAAYRPAVDDPGEVSRRVRASAPPTSPVG